MAQSVSQLTFERRMNSTMAWCLRHWLLFANGLVLLYGGLPWLSPLAHLAGQHWLGNLLFAIYTRLCHQKPEQSLFLSGYQVAFCERETVMYTALLVGGLLFVFLRKQIKPLPIRIGLLLLLPMLLDGGSQLIDDLVRNPILRGTDDTIGSFNFWTRVVTGLLFAIAVVWTVYPRLERDLPTVQVGAAAESLNT